MRHTTLLSSVALALLLSTSGCKKVTKLLIEKGKAAASQQDTNVAPAQTEAADPEVEADYQLGMKLNEYISCLNGPSSRAHDSLERYTKWVDEEKGITGKEKLVLGLYSVNDTIVERCTKAIEKAATMSPKLPEIEAVGQTYTAALNELAPLLEKASQYYDAKRYTGDDFAEGKKQHGPLMAAFEKFTDADEALRKQLDTIRSGMAERELKQIEKKHGKNLMYFGRKLIFDAKTVIEASDDATPQDFKSLQAAFASYEEVVKGLQERASSPEGKSERPSNYSFFEQRAVQFEACMRQRLSVLEGKTKYSQGESMLINNGNPQMVNGHPAQAIERFNDLIGASNDTEW